MCVKWSIFIVFCTYLHLHSFKEFAAVRISIKWTHYDTNNVTKCYRNTCIKIIHDNCKFLLCSVARKYSMNLSWYQILFSQINNFWDYKSIRLLVEWVLFFNCSFGHFNYSVYVCSPWGFSKSCPLTFFVLFVRWNCLVS